MEDYNIILSFLNALTIITLVFHIVKCFFGYKLGKILAAISGFFSGSVLGVLLVVVFCPPNEYFLTLLILNSFGLGLLIAILSFVFHKVGIFIYMFSTAFSFVYNLMDAVYDKYTDVSQDSTEVLVNNIMMGKLDNTNWLIVITALIAGIIMGIITMKYIRNVMIVATAVGSACSVSSSLFTEIFHYENTWVILIVAAALAVLGMTVQFKTTKYSKKRR